METERQIAAQAAYDRAFYLHHIAWGGGEKTRAFKRLQAANREKIEADNEASRITRADAGQFQGVSP
jgi:hypothetical protein